MIYWKFKVLLDTQGESYFGKWMDGLDPETYQQIDAMITRMKKIQIWSRPYFDKIHGYPKLHEIIVKGANKVPHRVIGCFRPKIRREFILLIGLIKKNRHYTPKNGFDIASRRLKLINKEGRLKDYE